MARTRDLPQLGTETRRLFSVLLARPVFRWALVVAAACLVIAGSAVHHQRQEPLRHEGELARVQVRQALQIASMKLNVARKKVLEINRATPASRL